MIGPYSVRAATEVERQLGQCVCSPECDREVVRVLNGPRRDGTTGDLAYCGFHYDVLLLVFRDLEVVADLIGPERSEGPYLAPRGQAGGSRAGCGHAEDIPARCELSGSPELRREGADGGSTEGRARYEGDRTA